MLHAVRFAESDMTEQLNSKRGGKPICTRKLSCFKEEKKKRPGKSEGKIEQWTLKTSPKQPHPCEQAEREMH